MAREQKPDKFKYSLDTVLRVRGIKERKEKEKFAEKEREYLQEKRGAIIVSNGLNMYR